MISAINQSLALGALGVASLLSFGGGFSNARRQIHRAHEARLKQAVEALRVHCDLLEKLDDEAVPPGLLKLALDVSHLCLDPDASAKFRALIKAGEFQRPERSPSDKRVDEDEYTAFASARPDLATAFAGSLITSLIAFETRWPDCAGVFGQELISMVKAPLEEARRVVDTAREMKFDWREIIPPGTPAFH